MSNLEDNRYPGFITPSCLSPTPVSPRQQIIRCGICKQPHSPTQPCTPAPRHATRDAAASPPRLVRASGMNVASSRYQRNTDEYARKSTRDLEADAISTLDLLLMRLFKEEDDAKKRVEAPGLSLEEKNKLDQMLKIYDKKIWHASELLEILRGLD